MIDRLSPRIRPSGFPVLHQRWSRLVFLHWRLAPDAVRALVPAALELDLCEGAAWVSLVAFTVSRMRPTLLPPIPGLSDAHQINVRTYVHRDGVPGLWFFSLDADNALAVRAARLGYRLAFFDARMHVGEEAGVVAFRSERTDPNAANATFDAGWQPGDTLPSPQPGTLDFFLLERYVLYSGTNDRMLRTRIHHRPWPLRAATLRHLASTMLEAHGLPAQADAPLAHAQAVPFDVEIWPPMLASRKDGQPLRASGAAREARALLASREVPASARSAGTDMRNANRPSGPSKPRKELSEAITEQEERAEIEAGAPSAAQQDDPQETARHAQRNARTRGANDRGRTARRPPGTAPGAAPPEGPSTAEISEKRRWVVVADEGIARIYEKPPSGGDLETVTELTDEQAHARRADLRRDAYGRRGAGPRPGSSVTSSASDDEMHLEGARFAARIAQWLAEGLGQKRYDELRLAAAPRFLGQLRKALDRHVGDVVVEEVAKDLTHESAGDLTARFFPARPPRGR